MHSELSPASKGGAPPSASQAAWRSLPRPLLFPEHAPTALQKTAVNSHLSQFQVTRTRRELP